MVEAIMHFRKKLGYQKEFTAAMSTERQDGNAAIGFAFVRDSDNFCRKIGRSIAVGRAKVSLEGNRVLLIPMSAVEKYKGTVDLMRHIAEEVNKKDIADEANTEIIIDMFKEVISQI